MSSDARVESIAPLQLGGAAAEAKRPSHSLAGRMLQTVLPGTAVILGGLLVIGPIVSTIMRSVGSSDDYIDFTLANFLGLFTDPLFQQSAINSAITGLGVTVFASILGCTLAWIVARTDLPGRGIFEIINLVPFFFSPYVGAMSWLYLAAPHSGLLPKLLNPYIGQWISFPDIYSVGGVIWVLTLFYTPYIYLFVIAPMRSMDGALEDAARVHGASLFYTIRKITFPLLLPSLLAGAMIIFVASAGLFDVPLSLAATRNVPMVPIDIFRAVQYPSDFGRASAVSAIMMTLTIAIAVIQQRWINRKRFDTVSGKGYRPRPVNLGFVGRSLALGIQILYFLVAAVLPIMALLMVSVSPLWTGVFKLSGANFSNFDYVLSEYRLTQVALYNSLYIGLVGATIGVILGGLQAYFIRRGRSRFRGLVEPLLSLPLGIPGIIIGLGFLILLIKTPLYTTIWIIIIACVAHFFPLALRNIGAMILSINPELEQSARASGATWLQTMYYILLPLVRPALIASWLLIFIILIRELGATILLYAQGTETISVALVILSEQNFGYVAALAVIQVIMLLTGFFLIRWTSPHFLGR
ncbi:MAG: iron ABC transporter permease [Variibacter sp.]|nr:iron ABC transporter permease [Variibacter sp.]